MSEKPLHEWMNLVGDHWPSAVELFKRVEAMLEHQPAPDVWVLSLMLDAAVVDQMEKRSDTGDSWVEHHPKLVEYVIKSVREAHERYRERLQRSVRPMTFTRPSTRVSSTGCRSAPSNLSRGNVRCAR